MYGARKYLLHESEDTLPKAKIHYKRFFILNYLKTNLIVFNFLISRMFWLDKLTMFLLYSSLIWFILYLNIVEDVSNYFYDFLYNL